MQPYALVWDLDGTLVDSYSSIIPAAREFFAELGLRYSAESIYGYAMRFSLGTLIEEAAAEKGMDPEPLKARFNAINDSCIEAIRPVPHAAETLAKLGAAGHRSFVYTHRGASCGAILAQCGLAPYFTEVLTARNGFPRKPAPDGISFLMRKYGLEAERCCYIGDRKLDMQAAENAGIRGILYRPPGSPTEPLGSEAYIIRDLSELPALL